MKIWKLISTDFIRKLDWCSSTSVRWSLLAGFCIEKQLALGRRGNQLKVQHTKNSSKQKPIGSGFRLNEGHVGACGTSMSREINGQTHWASESVAANVACTRDEKRWNQFTIFFSPVGERSSRHKLSIKKIFFPCSYPAVFYASNGIGTSRSNIEMVICIQYRHEKIMYAPTEQHRDRVWESSKWLVNNLNSKSSPRNGSSHARVIAASHLTPLLLCQGFFPPSSSSSILPKEDEHLGLLRSARTHVETEPAHLETSPRDFHATFCF